MVVDSEVNGGLEGHGFQGGMDGMALVQGLAKYAPWDNGPTHVETRDKERVSLPSYHLHATHEVLLPS